MTDENLVTLGLDLGTSSIGWCLINNTEIIDMGVRIFPEGVDRSRGEKSLNQDRREARSVRRQTYRRARRKIKLKRLLIDFNLLPDNETSLDELFHTTNPYELRSNALDKKLEAFQIGRALYHLGQRRGYLSNRKTGSEKDGKVAQGISEIDQAMKKGDFKTLGKYLNSLDPHEQRIRGQYTAREMFETEFEAIWAAQEKYHPGLFDIAKKKDIYDAIFYQRPLKVQKHLVGYCDFETDRKRAAKATLIAQEFRLWSNINNLKLLSGDGIERYLFDKERRKLYEALKERKQLSWGKVRDLLEIFESDKFNLEKVRKSGMLGNETAAHLKSALGAKRWKLIADRDKEQLVNDLLFINEDRALKNRLRRKWSFDEETIVKLIKKSTELPKGYMHVSQKAMRKIVSFMSYGDTGLDRGYNYSESCEKAGYVHTKPQEKKELDQLPFPGVTNKKHGEHLLSIVDTDGLRNPMVERALYQVRKVVNAIIRQHGKPDIIRVEMARDLKANARQRDDIKKRQGENEKANENADKFLREEVGISHPNRTDKIKYRLWLECEKTCPYSGNTINVHELFTQPVYEIEHIIPYSRCLDDSFMNKTLCHRDWNKKKGNQTPWEAFHGNEAEYSEMLQRARKFRYTKFKRFAADAIKDMEEFVSQQLNETRYISKKTTEYLQQLGVSIQPVKGGTTALLRQAWGLNNILSDTGEKTRLDHRHHAIDALVVALTSRGAVQKINTYSHVTNGRLKIQGYKPQLPDIRKQAEKAIDNVIVSHKTQRKIKGALHKEFLYSLTEKTDPKGNPVVAIRKSLSEMKESDLEHIRDPKIKTLAVEHLKNSKNYNDAFKNSENPFGMKMKKDGFRKINKVRLVYNRNVTSIGQVLAKSENKFRNVWTMGNHHMELIEYKDKKGNKKWRANVISTLEATLRNASNGRDPVVQTEYENGDRFLIVLHPNDMVKLVHRGEEKICRVQKMDVNEKIIFREHTDADKKDWKKEIRFSSNTLIDTNLTLLEVDPVGVIVKEQVIE